MKGWVLREVLYGLISKVPFTPHSVSKFIKFFFTFPVVVMLPDVEGESGGFAAVLEKLFSFFFINYFLYGVLLCIVLRL